MTMTFLIESHQTKSIDYGYTSTLIPNPSPKGRREHESKSLSPRERDLG
jgi:hypothetical protein